MDWIIHMDWIGLDWISKNGFMSNCGPFITGTVQVNHARVLHSRTSCNLHIITQLTILKYRSTLVGVHRVVRWWLMITGGDDWRAYESMSRQLRASVSGLRVYFSVRPSRELIISLIIDTWSIGSCGAAAARGWRGCSGWLACVMRH